MTNRQLVAELRELGHNVEIYIRKDGSLRIVSLDGTKFSSRLSIGNEVGRALLDRERGLTDEELSRQEAVKAQRAAAQASRKTGATLRSQTKAFQSELRRFQQKVRKINEQLQKEGKTPSFQVNWRTIKAGAEKSGLTVKQQLKRMQDYYARTTQGVAPAGMVASLKQKLKDFMGKFPELETISKVVNANARRLDIYETDKTIDFLYGYVQGIKQSETVEERAAKLKATVHK